MIGEITLELSDFAVIGTMLAGFGAVGVVLVQGNIKALVNRIAAAEQRISRVEEAQTKKADKHDWAREILHQRGKMERLSGQMERVEAKLDNNFGLAAQIARLADALEKRRKENA